MSRRRILKNVCSTWMNLTITMILTFFVSPIIVHSLGIEVYGLWVIIVSITGYFTVLDLGINTAIVKYVSEYFSQEEHAKVRQIFSTSLIIFTAVAALILVAGSGISLKFESFFKVKDISSQVILLTFWIVVIEMAIGMVFSVYTGTLAALQEFVAINAISIAASVMKNLLIVFFLLNGYGIVTMALVQFGTSLFRCVSQTAHLRKNYRDIYFEPRSIDLSGFRQLYNYSIYSFIIAIALKILFYTDSLVIGRLIGLQQVTYYAIPSTLLDYIEKFVWAMIAVLVPVISGNSALGEESGNRRLYLLGTRYSLLLSAPVIISLFWIGPDFITLWMGQEIGDESLWVLRILLLGYGFAFSQLIAHGLLKGIARHRVLALVMIVEAAANLLLSVLLAPRYGIEGVAFGTALPLWAATFALIFYTCRCLQISLYEYLLKGYSGAVVSILLVGTLSYYLMQPCKAYWQVFGQSFVVLVFFLIFAVPLCVDKDHLAMLRSRLPFIATR